MVKQLFRRQSWDPWNLRITQAQSVERFFPLSLNQERISYYAYARGALFSGITELGLGERDEVLIPDYICNTAIAPFHEAKVRVVYYRTRRDLLPDWEKIRFQVDRRTKAFFIINYFGLPNDLDKARKFCDDHQLFLIEDNAHGFLSALGTRALGSWGDISIFAFHKTICLPAGAALVVNKNTCLSSKKISMDDSPSTIHFILKSFLQQLKNLCEYSLDSKQIVRRIHPSDNDNIQEYDLKRYLLAMPEWSQNILSHLQSEKIKEVRRYNYQYWLSYFQKNTEFNIQPLFSFLLEGACPYAFPVYAEDREGFMQKMAKRGVETFVWPYLPYDSKERDLSRHVVCLPVWQDNLCLQDKARGD